jgi:hypothetical protein
MASVSRSVFIERDIVAKNGQMLALRRRIVIAAIGAAGEPSLVRPRAEITDEPGFLTLARLVVAHRGAQRAIAIDWLGDVDPGLHPAGLYDTALGESMFHQILQTAAAERGAE